MARIRKQRDREGTPKGNTRARRLLSLLEGGGQWYNFSTITMIYWNGEKWLMWEGPDPLKEAEITIATRSDQPPQP